MRRVTVLAVALAILFAATPAMASDVEPINNRNSTANAFFYEGVTTRVEVGVGESIGAMNNPVYANLRVFDAEQGLNCFGFTQSEGINSYGFSPARTFVDADIPINCGSTIHVVHLRAVWRARDLNINVSEAHSRDPFYGTYNYVIWTAEPEVISVELTSSDLAEFLGDIPQLSSARVDLFWAHGVRID